MKMNETAYKKELKSVGDYALRSIIKDRLAAIEANPENEDNAYYAEEARLATLELNERRDDEDEFNREHNCDR